MRPCVPCLPLSNPKPQTVEQNGKVKTKTTNVKTDVPHTHSEPEDPTQMMWPQAPSSSPPTTPCPAPPSNMDHVFERRHFFNQYHGTIYLSAGPNTSSSAPVHAHGFRRATQAYSAHIILSSRLRHPQLLFTPTAPSQRRDDLVNGIPCS